MFSVKLESGGQIFVYQESETPPEGEPFFWAKEFAYAKRLSKNSSEPGAEREFWRVVMEKKLNNPNYTIYAAFPLEGSGLQSHPAPVSPSAGAAPSQNTARHNFPGAAICANVIESLKGRGAKSKQEREEEAS